MLRKEPQFRYNVGPSASFLAHLSKQENRGFLVFLGTHGSPNEGGYLPLAFERGTPPPWLENTQFGKFFLVETKRMEWQIHSFGTEMK